MMTVPREAPTPIPILVPGLRLGFKDPVGIGADDFIGEELLAVGGDDSWNSEVELDCNIVVGVVEKTPILGSSPLVGGGNVASAGVGGAGTGGSGRAVASVVGERAESVAYAPIDPSKV